MPTEALRLLVTSLTEAVCAGLVYACRNLQAEVASDLRTKLGALNVAVNLIEDSALADAWRHALDQVARDQWAHPLLKGQATRTLYDHGTLAPAAAALHLSRALSQSVSPAEAGDWLDGFIGESGQVLLHDDVLLRIIDHWLVGIGEQEFNDLLPVLRRAFSSFDRSERRRLLDQLGKAPRAPMPNISELTPADGAMPLQDAGPPGFAAALPLLLTILGALPAVQETGS
jgi:hypothetical protein